MPSDPREVLARWERAEAEERAKHGDWSAGYATAMRHAMQDLRAALSAQPSGEGEREEAFFAAGWEAAKHWTGYTCRDAWEVHQRHATGDLRVTPTPAPAAREVLRPEDDWHEDYGPVLWWNVGGSGEPPYCGTPPDDDFPHDWVRPLWCPLPEWMNRAYGAALNGGADAE